MNKDFLFCLAIRNAENTLPSAFYLLKELSYLLQYNGFRSHISIYENDSTDNTCNILDKIYSKKYNFINSITIKSEKLNTKLFGSVIDDERVINLARARNNSIFQSSSLQDSNKLIMVDVDVTWNPLQILPLVTQNLMGHESFNIVSPWSIFNDKNMELYDKWATRYKEGDNWWDYQEDLDKDFLPCWSVGNGFLVADADPFKHGLEYSAWSDKFKRYDCEHVVLCEKFRKIKLDKIAISTKIFSNHPPSISPTISRLININI